MKKYELLKPDGAKAGVFACGECHRIAPYEGAADTCCCCFICGGADPDRKDVSNKHHAACWEKQDDDRHAARIEKAQKLETWDGWICTDKRGPIDDGYAESVESLVEWMEEEIACGDMTIEEWPQWVFVCKPVHYKLDLDSVIENFCSDGFEDMENQINGEKELAAAIKAFNEANKDLASYCPDYKRVVRVPEPSADFIASLAESAP